MRTVCALSYIKQTKYSNIRLRDFRVNKKNSSFWSRDRDYFLKKIGLTEESINWPGHQSSSDSSVDYISKNPDSIENMYGFNDLSKLPVFNGGYINFGYWRGLSQTNFGIQQRIEASEHLYAEVTETLNIGRNSKVVDVGCGTGAGVGYILKKYCPDQLIGIDKSPDQVERAKNNYQKELSILSSLKLNFLVGDAMDLPFEEDSLTHVISVEAAQHFPSTELFICEANRVLESSGKLAFTSFFATNPEGREAVKALIPDYKTHCSDECVGDIFSYLNESMINTEVKSIGENVWFGLEKWLLKIGFSNQWTILWPALYRAGYVDYFLFSAEKSSLNKNLFASLPRVPVSLYGYRSA
jgi:ubiquinone/menaquinone biosynthesis C-methylase UbiE